MDRALHRTATSKRRGTASFTPALVRLAWCSAASLATTGGVADQPLPVVADLHAGQLHEIVHAVEDVAAQVEGDGRGK